MRVCRRLSSLVIVLILAGSVRAEDEAPEFEGKTAKQWAKALEYDPDTLEGQKAMVRLARGGADAVPVLVDLLARDRDGGEDGTSAVLALQILEGIAIHDRAAGSALIEQLCPVLADRSCSFEASLILELLVVANPDARQPLQKELERLLAEEREVPGLYAVKDLLVKTQVEGPEGTRRLLGLLLSGGAGGSAYTALQDRGKQVLPLLLELLPTAKEEALSRAALVLDGLKIPADELFDGLLPAKGEPGAKWVYMLHIVLIQKANEKGVTFEHRCRLYWRLEGDFRALLIPKMKEDAKSAPGFAEFAAEALADEETNDGSRIKLLDLVQSIESKRAGVVVPHLIAGLKHPEPSVREASVRALEGVGSAAPQAIPVLQKALEGETDADVRRAIETAVDQLQRR